jgi:hypothetical protein
VTDADGTDILFIFIVVLFTLPVGEVAEHPPAIITPTNIRATKRIDFQFQLVIQS